jgi:hypothetical protein
MIFETLNAKCFPLNKMYEFGVVYNLSAEIGKALYVQ